MFKAQKRGIYFLVFFILLIIEIYIGVFVTDRFVRPYVGDVLVVAVIYYFVRIFLPDRVNLLPLYVFLFALVVEFLQYFDFVNRIGLENEILRTIIGTSFAWADIACYAIGCAIIFVLDIIRLRLCKRTKSAFYTLK